jgi:hypothetical protein
MVADQVLSQAGRKVTTTTTNKNNNNNSSSSSAVKFAYPEEVILRFLLSD